MYIQKQKIMNESLQKVLKMIPLGVLIINKDHKDITFANSQIGDILDKGKSMEIDEIRQELEKFKLKEKYEQLNE